MGWRRQDGSRPFVVVGAGVGGLAAAIRLRCASERPVILLERNPTVGGKMGEHRDAGFRWDNGPSVITLPALLDELFAAAGETRADWLTLEPVDPMVRCLFSDGDRLDVTADPAAMTDDLNRLDPRDVAGYRRFLAYAERLWQRTAPTFVFDQAPGWRQLLWPGNWLGLLRADPFRTMAAGIASHLHSPKLRAVAQRFASYVGASPLHAPATLNVIAHVELNTGIFYPRGGMWVVADALRRLAEKVGVDIRTGQEVRRLLTPVAARAYVSGVELADRTVLAAEAVVFNGDVSLAYQHLLPERFARRGRGRMVRPPSASAFILQLGVRGEYPDLLHHNMLYSSDYLREFRQIVDDRQPPTEPSLYVAITSKTDPTHAPPGHENWYVLALTPPMAEDGRGFDWATQAAAYRSTVLRRLAEHGFDIADRIVAERMWTPPIHAEHTVCLGGGLFGPTNNEWLSALRRPPNRDPYHEGLFFVGANSHPGAGVPMVLQSATCVVDAMRRAGYLGG